MTGTILNQDNLFDCAGRILQIAAATQRYRLSKPGLTPQQLSELDAYEHLCRSKALRIARAVSDTILVSLKDSIKALKQSTVKVKEALEELKEVNEAIQGITQVIEIANSIISVIG